MDLDDELCFQLVRSANLVSRTLRRQRRELGLKSGESRVLECLAAEDGQLARDIARACALDKSALTPVLRGMVERGLVTRKTLPEDGRASRILLTERGREVASLVRDMVARTSERVSTGLTEGQRNAFVQALHVIASQTGEA